MQSHTAEKKKINKKRQQQHLSRVAYATGEVIMNTHKGFIACVADIEFSIWVSDGKSGWLVMPRDFVASSVFARPHALKFASFTFKNLMRGRLVATLKYK